MGLPCSEKPSTSTSASRPSGSRTVSRMPTASASDSWYQAGLQPHQVEGRVLRVDRDGLLVEPGGGLGQCAEVAYRTTTGYPGAPSTT